MGMAVSTPTEKTWMYLQPSSDPTHPTHQSANFKPPSLWVEKSKATRSLGDWRKSYPWLVQKKIRWSQKKSHGNPADFFTGFSATKKTVFKPGKLFFGCFLMSCLIKEFQRILADVMFACFVCFDQLHHHFWMQNLLSLLTNRSQVVWIDADGFFCKSPQEHH